uniref:Cilia and flagella associated protein 44 n=1 Tax=Rousettus aegyptiacus TaxID=9407 RepID=A0A7J8HMS9_ROUAE|nr:cilia and flagella associated protein 44 [Rousettus aegyptiacus]
MKEKEREERRKQLAAAMGEDGEKEFHEEEEEEEEEEEPLPEIFVPSTPCHILCGFYSGPEKFWVSLFGIETEPIPQDIDDPKAYSIEDARKKREHDKLMKEVEEIKAGKREQLRALRNEFQKLLQMNEELPKHMQFKRTDFDLDSKIRAEINKKTVRKIQQVEKELAWDKEKHELGLMKLQNRFRDSLQSDAIVVHAIQSDHKIASYRLMKPSKYSRAKQTSQSERRPSKMERFDKEGVGKQESQKDKDFY